MRDSEAEKILLHEIKDLNYALLQRDWYSHNHGDLDIVLSAYSWATFVDRIVSFSTLHNYKIVQAYEIEYGIICIVILTSTGRIHLDIAISLFRKELFKLNLAHALNYREMVSGCYIVSKEHEDIYVTNKRIYKNSVLSIWWMRFNNFHIFTGRFISNLIFMRGLIIYIPYINQIELLNHKEISDRVISNLTNKLLHKYTLE